MTLKKAIFVKKNEVKTIRVEGTSIHLFRENAEDQVMEPVIITQAPKTSGEWTDGRGPFLHEGEELHFILQGKLIDVYDGRGYLLEEGDYFYFHGMKPHIWKNPGEEPAKVFIVVAPTLTARIDYYDHLSPGDREYAYKRMREFGIKPPEEKPKVKRGKISKEPVLVRRKDYQRQTVEQVIIDFPTLGVRDQYVELCVVSVGPKAPLEWTDGRGPFRHDGEEFVYILEGTVKGRIGDEVRVLEAGDYAYWPGIVPHRFENVGETTAKILIGESPPISVRPDYYDHLSPGDREYAYKRMREFGIKPPEEKPKVKRGRKRTQCR